LVVVVIDDGLALPSASSFLITVMIRDDDTGEADHAAWCLRRRAVSIERTASVIPDMLDPTPELYLVIREVRDE
jgi:hypothetical protein